MNDTKLGWRQTRFAIDGMDWTVLGWTDGSTWNGWQCPHFEFAEAQEVIGHFSGRYVADKDAFEVPTEGANERQDGEVDEWEAHKIITKSPAGIVVHLKVYAIGAWAWVWNEIPLLLPIPTAHRCRRLVLWEAEFGAEYAVPDEVLKHPGIVDMSWHNDMCPSFTLAKWERDGDEPTIRLWVEHPDATQRELGVGASRFTVSTQTEDLYAGGDVSEALAALERGGANKRFVWLVGAVAEVYPDVPAATGGDLVMWDRQEKRPVVTIHGGYAQAICLEHTTSAAAMPITTLERWFNGLSNEGLTSENIPATKPGFNAVVAAVPVDKLQEVAALLADLGASYEYPGYISIRHHGFAFAFGDANGPFSGNYGPADDEGAMQEGLRGELPMSCAAEVLAEWAREQIIGHATSKGWVKA